MLTLKIYNVHVQVEIEVKGCEVENVHVQVRNEVKGYEVCKLKIFHVRV